ncbi:IS3 family transposase [Nocardia beijingensis]|uniref:IS3 family transposase n=1 Tax=Nocardia beijingensis TaxID=95162 RepID=UPI001C3FF0EF|nr:IS3 family transposase [Nocardia beijingensis]
MENALRDLEGRPEQMYGRRKMTRYLRRQGHDVAFCTVDRIMRELGINGVVRGRKHRTTIPAKDGVRAIDKLNRDFTAAAPNLGWVSGLHLCLDVVGMGLCGVRVRCLLPRDRRLDRCDHEDDRVGVQSSQHGRVAA